MSKEIHSKQGHQIRQRPVELGPKLEEAKDQHRNQCCPNLNLNGIGAGPYKGFDLEILLQSLKEDFHLPTVFIDGRNGRRP